MLTMEFKVPKSEYKDKYISYSPAVTKLLYETNIAKRKLNKLLHENHQKIGYQRQILPEVAKQNVFHRNQSEITKEKTIKKSNLSKCIKCSNVIHMKGVVHHLNHLLNNQL